MNLEQITELQVFFTQYVCHPLLYIKGNEKKSKAPYIGAWQKLKKTPYEKLLYYTVHPNNETGSINMGLITGKLNNITVIDIDLPKEKDKNIKKDGLEKFNKLLKKYTKYNNIDEYINGDNIPSQKTRRDGYHLIYKYDKAIKQTVGLNNTTIDIRNDKGYIVMAGSKCHCNGTEKPYIWIKNIKDSEPSKIPLWFKKWILKNKKLKNRYIKKSKTNNISQPINKNLEENDQDDLQKYKHKKIKQYLECIKSNTINNRENWIRLGFVIYNEKLPFKIWHNMSKRGKETYKGKQDCINTWNTFSNNSDKKANIETLRKMAKVDNPAKYKTIINVIHEIEKKICRNFNERKIAKFLVKLHNNKYICSDIHRRDYIMHYFNGTIWKKDKGGCQFKKDSYKILKKYVNIYLNVISSHKLYDKQEFLYKKTKKLKQYMGEIHNQNKIYISYCQLTYDDNFYKKLNSKLGDLIAFRNCVYDMIKRKVRNGRPVDMLSVSTGYNFPDKNNTEIKKAIKFLYKRLKEIYTNKEVLDFVLKIYARMLDGGNQEQRFYCHIGRGANGKTVIESLLSGAFGNYTFNYPIHCLLHQKNKQQDRATPDIINFEGKLFTFSSESEEGDILSSNRIKKISGGDDLTGRRMRRDEIETIKNKSILHTFSNKPFNFDGSQFSFIRRTVLILYNSLFTEDIQKVNNKNIFEKDTKLLKLVKENVLYHKAFMLILLNHYTPDNIVIPSIIKKDTKELLDDNNDIKRFINENIEQTTEKTKPLTVKEIFTFYKNSKEYKRTNRKDFQRVFENELNINCKRDKRYNGKRYCNCFLGLRFMEDDNDNPFDN